MLFGAQVKQAGGLEGALARAEAMGAEVVQLFAQSNRQWRYPEANAERAIAFGRRWPASPVVRRVVCHAPYLVNLASTDPAIYDRSVQCVAANLRAAVSMGAIGLVVHLGSHLGAGLEARIDRVAEGIHCALDAAGTGAWLLLENTAGAGGTIGRTFEELAAVIDRAGGDSRLGVCLDTQHLWASGVPFPTVAAADAVVRTVAATVGLDRLRCLHVNDSKSPRGSGLDRHESLGKGLIGEDGLRCLLGHPKLQGLPAVLEVPGYAGDGPAAEDIAAARRLHEEGLAMRRRRRPRPARAGRP